ncbi:multiple sugar transport system substrate-binding protein [Pullulanibacillus pueri]|uniref:Sugar ABC transporter substrate-binding protein n=1 Tax=Pullulanibacillus pueri TaxID=1437324 RepID=A0A8J3ELH1_9BACL|nr:sugar ABC transporter substrate-binding protein [Pullulanibacillus pueri]MBM7680828.1 multiple sugar transport system substrate-binding protein [Pullulanibacillus pueri]GGH78490.1 sugar ABC transporter substrate-binding protein [Pullulanibacillus pueri]
MKNKKARFIAVFLIIAALALSACSSGSSDSKSDDKTIKVWTMSPALKDFAKKYTKESGVKVEVQSIPWDSAHDKLLTAVASGKGPDVLQIGNTWVSEFAEAGTFLDLSKYIDDYDNLNPDNFYDSAIETTKYDGKTIGIPWYVDTRALFYRTDILADVGYPKGPETWDDMIDASKKLAARGKDQYAIDLPATDPQFPFMLAWEFGWNYDIDKGVDNFKEQSFKDAIALHHLFYKEGYSQTGKGKEFFQSFSDGSKPMFISGPWDIKTINDRAPEIKGKWDVRLMPKQENNKSMMGGAHLAVFHNSKKVDQALDFINWMADPETQVDWYKTNSELPANKKAWDDPVLADDPKISTFGEQLESTQALPLIPEYERMGQDLIDTLEQINRGGVDIDSALKDYQSKEEKVLKD